VLAEFVGYYNAERPHRTRTPDARAEATPDGRSDPLTAGAKRTPPRLRTRRLSPTEDLPSNNRTLAQAASFTNETRHS
jgi:hypothetical protein